MPDNATPEIPQPIVAQHNALVNARFSFSSLETRLFLAMLVRIDREAAGFSVVQIPVRELSPESNSNTLYADVDEMTKKLASRVLHIEVLAPDGSRERKPSRLNRPLMARCDYLAKKGIIEAKFNEEVRDYLLDLRRNFTQAQVSQLLLIRSPTSHRIYWLVREYAQQGKASRDITVEELRDVLGFTTEYAGRFDHFKARVLDRAQQELAATDLPITFEFERKGRAVSSIRFLFPPIVAQAAEAPAEGTWQALLVSVGITVRSLDAVQAQLDAGTYDEGYIAYVVKTVQHQVTEGKKVPKVAGAIYKALKEAYWVADYAKTAVPSAPKQAKPGISPAARRAQSKLQDLLDDNQRSLRWILHEAPESVYPGVARQQAAAAVEAEIAKQKQQLESQVTMH